MRMTFLKTFPGAAAAAVLMTFLGAQASPAGGPVYIPLGEAGRVLVVNPATDQILGAVEDLPNVHGLGVSRDGRVVVAGSLDTWEAGEVNVARPADMAEGDHAAHPGTGTVSEIDTDTWRITRHFQVGTEPEHLEADYHDSGLVFRQPDGQPIVPERFSKSFAHYVPARPASRA